MFARFFVDRPIFAWVISIVIVLAGVVAGLTLPIAQYPEISPPTVQVSAVYPGANAKVVADTVAAPIEQQVNGVENMLYMSSTSGNDGSYNLTITFALGTDLNMAQVLVQNRVQLATPQLPEEVQRTGLSVKKKSPNILLVVNLTSPDDSRDRLYLSNYATIQLKDEIARIEGVGDVTLFGQQDYSMRAWLDPDKLTANGLTATDVVNAVREQNVQVAAGSIGQEPAPKGQAFQFTVSTLGRLSDAQQFGDIIIKTGTASETGPAAGGAAASGSAPLATTYPTPGGIVNPAAVGSKARAVVRLRDVARIDLGAKSQDIQQTVDGRPSVGMAVFQLPGSNALDTADAVKGRMTQLAKRFPTGIQYGIYYDTTPFIIQSVEEVFHSLRDAIILVAVVVLFFLQDWRAMILPMIDVPVALTGTFAVMYLLGFSMNNLTLFGLVLAIGIVVDDAIVVLENIERWIADGYDARSATIHAMAEITGPIVAITLVLSSVFIPSSFLGGISGQFYRQFALTIASAMAISAVNAMTLAPARAVAIFKSREKKEGGHFDPHHGTEALPWWGVCALLGYLTMTLLEKYAGPALGLPVGGHGHGDEGAHVSPEKLWGLRALFIVPGVIAGWFLAAPINAFLGRVFRGFNKVFDVVTEWYGRAVAVLLRVSFLVLAVYGGLLVLTYFGMTRTPIGFIPVQDKGYLLVSFQLPDAASVQRTAAVMAQIDDIVLGPVGADGKRDRAKGVPGCAHTVGIGGYSVLLGAGASNFGTMFITLDPFEERAGNMQEYGLVIMQKLQAAVRREVQDATVGVFPPPPVDGLGSGGGWKLMVEDRGDVGLESLQQNTDALIKKVVESPGAGVAFTQFRANTPQLYADVDRTKAKQLGVKLSDVFSTLQVYLGGQYVNDFNRFGRTWQVNLQADAPFRISAEYVSNLRVRNDRGEMVPLGAVAKIENVAGPLFVQRYNLYPAAAINGNLPTTTSSGQGIALVDAAAAEVLPRQLNPQWTELFYLQQLEGNSAVFAFLGAVVLVYLVLAAQYESWSLPLAIILVVPMCLLSAIVGVRLAGLSIDIFVQVGFIVLVGLAAKNAILVVEFAQQQRMLGLDLWDATLKSVRLRLRPIVMTSFAFILGVVPLVLAEGAGMEMRKTLGIAVFSGMLGVTLFGLVLTPVFYYVIEKYTTGTGPVKPHGHAPIQPIREKKEGDAAGH